jgi:hypothetical protein
MELIEIGISAWIGHEKASLGRTVSRTKRSLPSVHTQPSLLSNPLRVKSRIGYTDHEIVIYMSIEGFRGRQSMYPLLAIWPRNGGRQCVGRTAKPSALQAVLHSSMLGWLRNGVIRAKSAVRTRDYCLVHRWIACPRLKAEQIRLT